MRFTWCAVSPSSLVYPVCNGPLIPYCSWKMRFIQCATSPSSILRTRFSQCAVGPSFLLRDDRGAHIVCSGYSSLTEPERWSLPSVQPAPHPWEMKFTSVQWALHHSWERRFTQCAVGPSSLLRDEVYLVCPSSLLREEVYLVCRGPFIPLERGGLPSVQWVPHSSWERRFTECAVGPSSLPREEVYLVCSGPFIPLERGGLPSVQWAPYPSWERRFT